MYVWTFIENCMWVCVEPERIPAKIIIFIGNPRILSNNLHFCAQQSLYSLYRLVNDLLTIVEQNLCCVCVCEHMPLAASTTTTIPATICATPYNHHLPPIPPPTQTQVLPSSTIANHLRRREWVAFNRSSRSFVIFQTNPHFSVSSSLMITMMILIGFSLLKLIYIQTGKSNKRILPLLCKLSIDLNLIQ